MNLSCWNCKAIQPFSGNPPKCDVCGWVYVKPTSSDRLDKKQAVVADYNFYGNDTGSNNDDVVNGLKDVEEAVGRVDDVVRDVEHAVNRVEKAVKDKWSSGQLFFRIFVVFGLWAIAKDIWFSKWRLGLAYDVSEDKITIDQKPHECSFLAAPLGEKDCHYDREITTLRWATNQNGDPIASYDEGKHWSLFTPDAGVSVPKYPTVQQVYVSWKKVEE